MAKVTEILNQQWYLLGQPWAHSDNAGVAILAGSPDPHAAIPVVDCEDLRYLWEGDYDLTEEESKQQARIIASHIVELHNSQIKG